MSYQSPLSKAKGLGAANEGVEHWWMQRITAAALVPLILFLVFALALLGKTDYSTFTDWLGRPYIAILIIVTSLFLFYHSSLGIQVVAEDYIAGKFTRITLMFVVNVANLVLAVMTVFAVLKIALGS